MNETLITVLLREVMESQHLVLGSLQELCTLIKDVGNEHEFSSSSIS